MDVMNLPVQVIVHCEAGGEMHPLRFQYEDEKHLIHTIQIDRVTDRRKTNYVGIDAIHYICKGQDGEKEHMYELRYAIGTHKWVLFRMIY